MRWIFLTPLALVLAGLLLVWVRSQLRYRVTPRSFKITLFGLRLRRIPLEAIERVSTKQPRGFTENWSNTLRPAHRILIIRLKGARKNLLFTPPHRYVFKTDLEQAMARLDPSASVLPEP